MPAAEYQLASAQTPLGLLQRGRGAGFLWSLEHAEQSRPLLVACITRDPRRDRQIESRGPYYAEIALVVGLDLAPLEQHLREHDDSDRDAFGSRLTVETLHAMACAGSEKALRIQRDYIAYGAHWDTALHGLVKLADPSDPPVIPGAERALDELLPVVRARFPDHAALLAALDREGPDYLPWREWATDNFVLRRSAEKIFARHAEANDVPMLRAGAQAAFEADDDFRVCSAMDALARIPQFGPYPEVRAVVDGHPYSRARADAAAALAATDPAFPSDRAFECLWDCDDSVRATGCTHVDIALPGARERLMRLASSPLEEDKVCESARLAQSRT